MSNTDQCCISLMRQRRVGIKYVICMIQTRLEILLLATIVILCTFEFVGLHRHPNLKVRDAARLLVLISTVLFRTVDIVHMVSRRIPHVDMIILLVFNLADSGTQQATVFQRVNAFSALWITTAGARQTHRSSVKFSPHLCQVRPINVIVKPFRFPCKFENDS